MPKAISQWLTALAVAALALTGAAPASARPLRASIDLSSARRAVPAAFLGLSFEVKALPQLAHYGDEGNAVKLLRSLGGGVIRLGGVTADTQAAWSRDGRDKPSWATTAITSDDLAGIGRLADEARWRVLLTVNLGHYDPSAAAEEVATARSLLATTLAGIEIGNEPDGYVDMNLRADPYSFGDYLSQVSSYLQALGGGFPLVGPDVSTPKRSAWIRGEAAVAPALLSAHYYPLSGCHDYLPVVGDLLSPGIRAREKRTLDRLAAISTKSGIPLRIGETNNIACGGEEGVSNTFASALWAVDYITRAMSDGIAGVNFHDIIGNCLGYGAVCAPSTEDLEAGRLTAQPEWYALLLTRQLVGDQPLRAKLAPRRGNVTIAAFRRGGRLHVVLVDNDPPDSRPALVRLPLPPRFATATVLRLTGPAPDAAAGVRLGGARVAADGSFHPRRLPRLVRRQDGFTVTLPPSSAALVTVLPAGH